MDNETKWGGKIPMAMDIEDAALHVILNNGAGITTTRECDGFTSEHFFHETNRDIWDMAASLDADGEQWDWPILSKRLHDAGKAKEGVLARLTSIVTSGTFRGATILPTYLRELEEARKARAMMIVMERALRRIREEPINADNLFATTMSEMGKAVTGASTQDSVTIPACQQVLAQIERARKGLGKPLGIYTGVPCYDSVLGGMFYGIMDVIGARPKVGKTSLLEITADNFIDQGRAVSIFQKDMSVAMMFARMACRKENIVFEQYIFGTLSKPELHRLEKRIKAMMKNAHLLRVHNPAVMTAAGIGAQVQKDKDRYGVEAFFLDQFQKIRGDGRDGKVEYLTDASIELRDVIDRTQVAGMIIAQISKEADKAGKPNSGMFKYCDQLFSDCDRSVLLWSHEDPKDLGVNVRQTIQFTVDVNRMGAPSDNDMLFHRELMNFEPSI